MAKTFGHRLPDSNHRMVFFTVLCGLAYPLAMTGVAQAIFPRQGQRQHRQTVDGDAVGSSLIGQNFSRPEVLPPPAICRRRAMATTPAASPAPTSGRLSQALVDAVTENAQGRCASENGLASDAPVPVDAVTASGSGLDPHISPAYAELQVARVAKERGHERGRGAQRWSRSTRTARPSSCMGEPRVNVLELNLALDSQAGSR